MRHRDQANLHLFDPEPERTLHRLLREQRTELIRNRTTMENNEDQNQDIEQNEPQRGRNGNTGRNQAPRPFIQPDDPFMLLDEFVLPPTVVQTAIRRPPIQANNFELKSVTVQMLQNILFHELPHENPNMHLTNFLEVCDTCGPYPIHEPARLAFKWKENVKRKCGLIFEFWKIRPRGGTVLLWSRHLL